MKHLWMFFYLFPLTVTAAGFLTAESFPETIADATFVERVENMREGYAAFESEYIDGRCVSNCIYPGITLEATDEYYRRATEQAAARAAHYISNTGAGSSRPVGADNIRPNIGAPESNAAPQQPYITPILTTALRCEPHSAAISATQMIPRSSPLDGASRISSGFGTRDRPNARATRNHLGLDYAVAVGTNVYAPAGGTIKNVTDGGNCGNGLRIAHADGFETAYCHLQSVTVTAGQTVGAGCLIGKSGNTGNSTGPHLHFEIHDMSRGTSAAATAINPTTFFAS